MPCAVITACLLGAVTVGCGAAPRGAPAGSPGNGSHSGGSEVAARSGQARRLGVLHGKYQTLGMALPGGGAGVVAISGYPGRSSTLRSWIDRTADGGRRWVTGPQVTGTDKPGAQYGMAFASSRQGWAYGPGLFFTRDGGATWTAQRTPFALTGPVAVAGASTWVTGYPCVRGNCRATIDATGRIGGRLRPLPGQPSTGGSVVVLQHPSASVGWLLLEGAHGRHSLVTTSDGGRKWAGVRLPCPAGEWAGQLSAPGPRDLWLVCEGTPGAGSFPGRLYRSADGGRGWTRVADENDLTIHAVSASVAWAVQANANGAVIVRTADGGRSWHTVLSRSGADIDMLVPDGPDGALAVARVQAGRGLRFVAYVTADGGLTWRHAALPG